MSVHTNPYTELSDKHKEVFDTLSAARGGLKGMYSTLFHHPELATIVSQLGTYLRYEGVLNPHDTEIVILSTARAINAGFVWQQHLSPAHTAGVDPQLVQGILDDDEVFFSAQPERTQLIYKIARYAALADTVPKRTLELGLSSIGKTAVIEIVVISGFYRMITSVVKAFEVPLPKPKSPPF